MPIYNLQEDKSSVTIIQKGNNTKEFWDSIQYLLLGIRICTTLIVARIKFIYICHFYKNHEDSSIVLLSKSGAQYEF